MADTSPPTGSKMSPSSFTTTILDWYHTNGRHLPWRATQNPYAIWLSEIILQQTRIQQGHDYWLRFMKTYPTVNDLATASEDDVLRLWQGLGYYSRARNLHAAARQIVEMGHFPTTVEGLKKLKGVGDYTAAAIASFAFGADAAVVDGNVYRVLARHFGITTPINTTEGKKEFALLAQELLAQGHSADYNQGLMDFGAMQCTPQSPRCLLCPLQETCIAIRTGQVEKLPMKQGKTKIKERHLHYIFIYCKGMMAVHRRGAGDIWQGLWEPLLIEDAPLPNFAAHAALMQSHVKHVLTHRILWADFYLLNTDTRPALPADYIWIPQADFEQYAKPQLIAKEWERINYK